VRVQLEETWNQWKECLFSKDRNAIFSQIILMLWDTAIYKIILQGRQLRIKENPENPQVNLQLHKFIDRNYFQAQSAVIRRLVDKNGKIDGDNGVYSLAAIIKDLKNHREKLDRKTYLSLRGMPYDYSEIQKNEREFILDKISKDDPFSTPSELDWAKIENAHKVFDRLSNVNPEMRSPKDLIEKKVFTRLENRLKECDRLSVLVNKFIAHSATPESREGINFLSIKGSEVWRLQKILYEVANFLGVVLFSVDTAPLPGAPYSSYLNWDKPLFLEEERQGVYDIYMKYEKETDDWRVNSVENMWKVIEEL